MDLVVGFLAKATVGVDVPCMLGSETPMNQSMTRRLHRVSSFLVTMAAGNRLRPSIIDINLCRACVFVIIEFY